jgi:hypothetical protein
MDVSVVLVIGIVGLFVWAYVNQRGNQKKEVEKKLRSTVVLSDDKKTKFDGAEAKILLSEYFTHGGEDFGPRLSGRYLCKMPNAGVYWVVVMSTYDNVTASAEVSELDEAEINHVLAMYPYLKNIQKSLTS